MQDIHSQFQIIESSNHANSFESPAIKTKNRASWTSIQTNIQAKYMPPYISNLKTQATNFPSPPA
jgi:hypothetical protein